MVEQKPIAERLRSSTAPVTTAISRLEREIELLREYRTRLVADVVTGKLDVREAAARLPDESAELERLDKVEAPAEEDDIADDSGIDPEQAEIET